MQRREDAARVHREGAHADIAPEEVDAEREQGIGGLRLSVGLPFVIGAGVEVRIIPEHVRARVADGGERHDTGAFGRLQLRGEFHGQRHVAEMVGAELAFPALADAGEGAGHDAGIVDQEVQRPAGPGIVIGKAAHAGEVGKVHRRDLDLTGDAGERFGCEFRTPRGYGDARPGRGEGADGFQPDAGIAAGDDGILALEVDALDDFLGRALGMKAGADRFLVLCRHGVSSLWRVAANRVSRRRAQRLQLTRTCSCSCYLWKPAPPAPKSAAIATHKNGEPIMKMHKMLGAALLACVLALPAAAQFGQVQRTQAEIALEETQGRQAKAKAAREAAEAACAAKDLEGCFKLADMQRTGTGGLQDLKAAAKTYKTMCDAKDGRGCAGLAYLNVRGRGVTENQTEGRNLYKKACDYGDVSGCAAWGNMAYTGTGGRKDVVAGTQALSDACDREYEWACTRMRDLGVYNPEENPFDRLRVIRGE